MGFSIEHFFQELLTYLNEPTIDADTRQELLAECIRTNAEYAKTCGVITGEYK